MVAWLCSIIVCLCLEAVLEFSYICESQQFLVFGMRFRFGAMGVYQKRSRGRIRARATQDDAVDYHVVAPTVVLLGSGHVGRSLCAGGCGISWEYRSTDDKGGSGFAYFWAQSSVRAVVSRAGVLAGLQRGMRDCQELPQRTVPRLYCTVLATTWTL